MSENILFPFIKCGSYKSTDKDKPDILEIKVVDTQTFETEYSINVPVQLRDDKKWNDMILPLKSHNSTNASLLRQWSIATKEGRLKKGKIIKIETWMGTSKNGNPIRRPKLVT